ncbi:MAG: type II secretion system F family protein [Candidatus Omnitrophota bacterium]
MPLFRYLATDFQNKQVRGDLQAKDINEAKLKLKQSNLFIVAIRKEQEFLKFFGPRRVRNMDLAVFSHQFAVLVASGIPVIKAFRALAQETGNKYFRSVLEKLKADVENGASLGVAMARYPQVFSVFFINLVKSGEAAGMLPTVLSRLASHLEKTEELRRKVRGSFAYPAVVGVIACAVIVFLLIYIVPVFQSVYKTLRVQLPLPTQTLILASNVLVGFWWLLAILIGAGIVGLRLASRNREIVFFVDQIKLRLPLFGSLNRKVAVSRFVRTLSTMVGSGLPLSNALGIARDVVGNQVVIRSIDVMRSEIIQGKNMAEALRAQDFFPPMVVQMIAAGEESGQLTNMLDKCADFLDESVDAMIKGLIVVLEPALTFILAGLVGFIALAIYLPMFDLIRQASTQ